MKADRYTFAKAIRVEQDASVKTVNLITTLIRHFSSDVTGIVLSRPFRRCPSQPSRSSRDYPLKGGDDLRNGMGLVPFQISALYM